MLLGAVSATCGHMQTTGSVVRRHAHTTTKHKRAKRPPQHAHHFYLTLTLHTLLGYANHEASTPIAENKIAKKAYQQQDLCVYVCGMSNL